MVLFANMPMYELPAGREMSVESPAAGHEGCSGAARRTTGPTIPEELPRCQNGLARVGEFFGT